MSQRLLNSEVDARVELKLDKTIKKVDEGVNGLITFGQNNDYPQIIEKLVSGSSTAKACFSMYSKFLIGQGFVNEDVNNQVVGLDSRGKQITLLTLLRQTAESLALYNGFYIHCNVNFEGLISNVHLKSFKNCRFAKPDDTGFSAKILYYDNWAKNEGFKRYNKDEIIPYNTFNLNKDVLLTQIEKAGSISKFKGQIYMGFTDNQFFYPLSPFDCVYMDCDTESQIQLYKNRQLRNGFFDKIVMRIAPGGNEADKEELVAKVKSFLGADGETTLLLEDEVDEFGNIKTNGAFKIDTIKGSVNDTLFENWEKSISNNIRKALFGIPAILIDYEESKLGSTSGEAIQQAVNFYNALTNDSRDYISQSFQEIFKNSTNKVLANNENWEIKKINLYDTPIDNATASN